MLIKSGGCWLEELCASDCGRWLAGHAAAQALYAPCPDDGNEYDRDLRLIGPIVRVPRFGYDREHESWK